MSEETARCAICGQTLGAHGRCRRCEAAAHVWTIQDWRPLLTLGLVLVLGFSFTRLVVNAFDAKREELARQYYASGIEALEGQRAKVAVRALESALVYSNDNFQYQLKLTDALLATGATDEALAQLRGFLDQRPGDAQVNLKLARLEARRHNADEAWGYYQAAIKGVWPESGDPLSQRIAVRFEAAEYLVRQQRQATAEAALVALDEVLPEAAPEQQRLGELFLQNGDAARALKIFEAEALRERTAALELQAEHRGAENAGAENAGAGNAGAGNAGAGNAGAGNGGAGKQRSSAGEAAGNGWPSEAGRERYEAAKVGEARASFALGNFASARRDLKELPEETAESRELAAQLSRMEALDPFAEKSTSEVRAARTVAVFEIAIGRLAACGVPFARELRGAGDAQPGANGSGNAEAGSAADSITQPLPAAGAPVAGNAGSGNAAQPTAGTQSAAGAWWNGLEKWAGQLSPWMSERKLRGRDDVIESTMRFAFQAETMAQKECAAGTADDEALLLLARERMGAGR